MIQAFFLSLFSLQLFLLLLRLPELVLLLPDGRLGLIDYGMVGRLSRSEREAIARVVLGLRAGDREAVVGEYRRAGYRACWHSGAPHCADVIYRFATFHLDRINLSPVRIDDDEQQQQPPPAVPQYMPVMTLLRSTIEHSVPDWVEQGRRLGGLLIGVGSQAGRPISLASEWAPIAEEVLRAENNGEDDEARGTSGGRGGVRLRRRATARVRTHLTGLAP